MSQRKLTDAEVIQAERKLAKFANFMDSVVRIPFTRQGIGADAALSTIPFAGDVAGLALTGYAFIQGLQMGVPASKMFPAIRLAVADLFIGFIPFAGTLVDIFIRPSRRTLNIVHEHIRTEYDLPNDFHVERPFLHEALETRQKTSRFWRNPVISWLWLHIPDFLGVIVLGFIAVLLYWGFKWFLGFELASSFNLPELTSPDGTQ